MVKKQINIKISDEVASKLTELAKITGKTKTAIIENAILRDSEGSKQDHNQIELLSKQNEQMQMVLSATQALIVEKDHKYNDMIKGKDDLIAELKHKKRGFFSRLFGLNSIF